MSCININKYFLNLYGIKKHISVYFLIIGKPINDNKWINSEIEMVVF